MLVETPQILWNPEDKKRNAALTSVALFENTLATAGSVPEIQIWNLCPTTSSLSRPLHKLTLARHEGSVNALEFHPQGTELASGGETGALILFRCASREWTADAEVTVKIVYLGAPILDMAYNMAATSSELVIGTVDASVAVVRDGSVVWLNHDHHHYVQGVAVSNHYLCSLSSDRTFRIWKKQKRHKVIGKQREVAAFLDETTLESFVRRLRWTSDGAFLIVPSGIQQQTYLYARHSFDKPYKIFSHDKPSVAVVTNPLVFQDTRENKVSYRHVFAVLTLDSILVYDTVHHRPLAVAKDLHYANLVDGTWTADGHTLIVASSDGYLSFLTFSHGELGTPVPKPVNKANLQNVTADKENAKQTTTSTTTPKETSLETCHFNGPSVPPAMKAQSLPPCEPGTATIHAPPTKKKRVQPTLVS